MLHRFEFMTENLKNGLKPHPKWLLFRNVSILGNTRWMKQIGWMKHINGWEGQMGQKKQVGGMGQMGRRGWRMGYAEKETKKWWCLTWKLSRLVHSLQSDKNSYFWQEETFEPDIGNVFCTIWKKKLQWGCNRTGLVETKMEHNLFSKLLKFDLPTQYSAGSETWVCWGSKLADSEKEGTSLIEWISRS